jgi:hypothetical protein
MKSSLGNSQGGALGGGVQIGNSAEISIHLEDARTIRRFLGREEDAYPGQHGPSFRVLLAELISDNVCRRIVEEHARVLPHEFDRRDVAL